MYKNDFNMYICIFNYVKMYLTIRQNYTSISVEEVTCTDSRMNGLRFCVAVFQKLSFDNLTFFFNAFRPRFVYKNVGIYMQSTR